MSTTATHRCPACGRVACGCTASPLPRAIVSRIGFEPILWRCYCGQFNNTKDGTCVRCGEQR